MAFSTIYWLIILNDTSTFHCRGEPEPPDHLGRAAAGLRKGPSGAAGAATVGGVWLRVAADGRGRYTGGHAE